MKKHGFRSIFSLLLALMMVCSMLPTAAFAEGDVEEQPVVVETYTVTYADGMGGAAFAEQKTDGLRYGDSTPAFTGEPALDGYTFTGWDQEIAGTVTQSVTYTAQWQKVQQEAQSDVQLEADGNGETDMQNGPDGRPLLNPDGGHGAENGYVVYNVPPQPAGTIKITVKVFDGKQGYLVGFDTAKKADRGVQSEAYVIPELTKFVESGKFGRVTGVSGTWYWPGTINQAVGTTIYWSNNSRTGTMTYYVDWYNPNGGGDNPTPPTHYLWNFTLHYDANGGTGAPADQLYGTNSKYEKSYDFIISGTEPTREGYTFKGWSDTKDGSVTYQKGGKCHVMQTATGFNGGSVTKTLYAVWEKNAPNGPTNGEVTNLLGQVKVHCTTNAGHEEKTYDLEYYGLSATVPDGDGYTCYVYVDAGEYVRKYNGNYPGTDHVLADSENRIRSFVLRNDNDGKGWYISEGRNLLPIVFNVKCEAEEPTPPSAPTDEDLKNLDVPPVDVECTTKEEHTASYELLKDSYGIGAVVGNESGSYTCDVAVYAEEYVKEFCKTKYGPHLLDGNDKETLTLKYVDGKWVTDEWVTFKVKCVVPAKPTENDLAGIKVFVQCINSGATHGDKRKEYGLIGTDGYYYVGNPTFLESDGKYYCTVNVNGERYVAKYSTDTGVQHTYMSVDTVYKYAYLTATWTDSGYVWSVDKDGSTVTFEAWCETVPPAQTFTVTYKDGVAGKAFQDQSYTVPSGSATPAFNGTPYLAGYVFTDWTPAVATTVTANATYIATWKLDTNNNGKPDDEEERYTVTYTDGAGGKAFADQVYTGLLSGTSTPKFDGTPVRSGYVFIGWSPVWSGTVTGNVTYTATWSTITGGLDKVPKTGDNGLTLALSALLLFSFCGAAACVISTRKRG